MCSMVEDLAKMNTNQGKDMENKIKKLENKICKEVCYIKE